MGTVKICFWCGTKFNRGNPKDKVIVEYIPCSKCTEVMRKGVVIAELDDKPYLGQPPLNEELYPTGRWTVRPYSELVELGYGDMVQDIGGSMLMLPKEEYRAKGFAINEGILH